MAERATELEIELQVTGTLKTELNAAGHGPGVNSPKVRKPMINVSFAHHSQQFRSLRV